MEKILKKGRGEHLRGRHLFEKRFSSPSPIFHKLLYAIRPRLPEAIRANRHQVFVKWCVRRKNFPASLKFRRDKSGFTKVSPRQVRITDAGTADVIKQTFLKERGAGERVLFSKSASSRRLTFFINFCMRFASDCRKQSGQIAGSFIHIISG